MAYLMPFTPASSITRGVPAFRPSLCLAFDVIAAVVLAFLSSGAKSAAFHSNLMARS
jgi:hypothetical protein